MLKAELIKYKEKNKLSWEKVSQELGLSRRGLLNIIEDKSPRTLVVTCLKIEKLTGLKPWEYLNGLEAFKKLNKKETL